MEKVELERNLASLNVLINVKTEYQIAENAMIGMVTKIWNIYVILQSSSVYFNVFIGPLGGAT